MPQVIKNTQEQDDVERAVDGGVQIKNGRNCVLHLRAQQFLRHGKSAVIDRMTVGREDALGAATLGLKREEAVIAADIEHHPVKSFGEPPSRRVGGL